MGLLPNTNIYLTFFFCLQLADFDHCTFLRFVVLFVKLYTLYTNLCTKYFEVYIYNLLIYK